MQTYNPKKTLQKLDALGARMRQNLWEQGLSCQNTKYKQILQKISRNSCAKIDGHFDNFH